MPRVARHPRAVVLETRVNRKRKGRARVEPMLRVALRQPGAKAAARARVPAARAVRVARAVSLSLV